jgi:phosphoribosyl-dephospho-CoA transferase
MRMKHLEVDQPQVHDLLQIDQPLLSSACEPEPSWVLETLRACPWVVVRRAQALPGQIAVGVRGATRSERWGAFCAERSVSKIVRPEELLFFSRPSNYVLRTPALRALQEMGQRWEDLTLLWGPGGSVGFELASGRPVTTEESDLDLVIRAPRRIAVEEARSLLDRTIGLETKIDVRVETSLCGFSLEEYVKASSAAILLRYSDGVRLGEDPWLTAVERRHVGQVES